MSDTTNDRRDARRIPLETQVQYREVGQVDWCEGTTENISRSGVRFRGARTGEENSAVELVMTLPATGTGSGGRALCSGHIVRLVEDASGISLAARISSCRIVGRSSKDLDLSEWPMALIGEA